MKKKRSVDRKRKKYEERKIPGEKEKEISKKREQ